MKKIALILALAGLALALFLIYSSEQQGNELLQKIRLILRFGVKAMSIFFDLTMELLKGMMALERIFLGEATPQVQTPTPTTLPQTPVPTPTATSTVPPQAPTPISMEPIPPRQETVKCCGGIVVLILLISLAMG